MSWIETILKNKYKNKKIELYFRFVIIFEPLR